VWQGVLPRGALELEVGESDVSSEAVYRRGDSIAVSAPIPPGDKQVVVSYVLPRSGRRFDLTLDQPVARFNVLVEDTAATLEGDALDRMGSQSIEGTNFVRFARNDVGSGTHVVVTFPRGTPELAAWWWLVVGMAAAAMFGGLIAVWRRTRPAPVSVVASDAATLAAQIAALDEAFEQRPEATSAERDAYQRRRAELKAHLEQLLLHR
jgi:outer membrane murein-binding lipoprotein Lpp